MFSLTCWTFSYGFSKLGLTEWQGWKRLRKRLTCSILADLPQFQLAIGKKKLPSPMRFTNVFGTRHKMKKKSLKWKKKKNIEKKVIENSINFELDYCIYIRAIKWGDVSRTGQMRFACFENTPIFLLKLDKNSLEPHFSTHSRVHETYQSNQSSARYQAYVDNSWVRFLFKAWLGFLRLSGA